MRYDVALSFAGEDRAVALDLATRLQRAGLRVFFDRFEELWGEDLSERLHEVYDRQCRRVVVLVSQAYLRRPWTNFERRVLVARMLREDAGFLLPLRLDDSELPGLPGVIAYKDLREEGVPSVAASLGRLLRPHAPAPSADLTLAPSDFLYAVAHPHRPRATNFNLPCLLTNAAPGARLLRHLEALVVPAGHRPLQYQWHGCFTLGDRRDPPSMWPSDDALPLSIGPGASRHLGLVFEGGPLPSTWAWPVGGYEVTVSGWVDVPARHGEPTLQTRFGVSLTEEIAARLWPWMDPPPGAPLMMPVAVPLPIAPADV